MIICSQAGLHRRLIISVTHVTSLGCLRQKPSSFENFGCRYCTAFASISSNRNRGSFDSEGLECGIDRVGRENPEERKSLKASEGYTDSHDLTDLFLRIFDLAAITLM